MGDDTVLVGLRVFVVEDDTLVLMLLEEMLEDLGCQIVAASVSLDDALHEATSVSADVAILDVSLAGLESYPVGSVLRNRGIPYLFATGYGASGLPKEFENSHVLPKPYLQEQVAEALRAVVASQH